MDISSLTQEKLSLSVTFSRLIRIPTRTESGTRKKSGVHPSSSPALLFLRPFALQFSPLDSPLSSMKHSRIVSVLTVLTLAVSLSPKVSAFTDVTGNTPYAKAINELQRKGVVEGYEDGTFKMNAKINRAEFLKIVLESRGEIDEDASNCFPDVRKEWFAKYVCTAKNEGIVAGYPSGRFQPETEINFVEASKILSLAYGQPIEQYSPDWYEPYARALESSAAIPPSIGSLEQQITRGEMAEMMWRLSEDVTDEPAKSYMNVKYPEVKVNLAGDTPQLATSCADLRAFTEEAGRSGFGGMMKTMDSAMPPSAQTAGAERSAVSESAGDDYSQTNVQVEGVDEGDIVKTDGSSLFILRNSEVRIVDAKNPGSLKNAATITFATDGSFSPMDLYIEGNRLIVIGSSWENQGGPVRIMEEGAQEKMSSMIWPGPWMGRSFTVVKIYNVTNVENPSLERTVSIEGSNVSTRRIGDRLYVVTNQGPRYYGEPIPLGATLKETDIVPVLQDSARGNAIEGAVPCAKVMILPHVPSPSYLIVSVVPLRDAKAEVKRSAILGNGENVYASLENLYVASTDWNYVWNPAADQSPHQKTRLYRFAFTEDGTSFQAQGMVAGRILNQFSMDEHENHFRIATTVDGIWAPESNAQSPSSNSLYVLNRDLENVGSITDIAPGERIYSTRFLGDRTYMVTFRTIDPLFVIDTSDPRNPVILGQLKIPGYSDYLHPYDENHILGFGKEAVVSKDGTFAWQQGMKIALFDVTDVKNPVVMHDLVIGDRGTESPLLYNHKALLFEKARGLLAFPIRVHKITNPETYGGDPASAYGEPVFQGAHVYDLNLQDGFVLRGAVTHYTETDMQKAGGYFYGKDVDRIIRIGDSLYTVSQWGVKSNDEEDVEELGSLSFVDSAPIGEETCPDESQAGVKYISKDPDQCALVRFSCAEGTEAFSLSCGCGCKPVK